MFCVGWGSGLLGSALHGAIKPGRNVRGASGAIYGVMAAQLGLLLNNWTEMPARWVRLFICVLMTGCDVGIWWFDRRKGLSYESHLFGALAGVCVAAVLGKNVRLRRHELLFIWSGFGGYVSMVVAGIICEQYFAASLASVIIPVLLFRAGYETRKALLQKRTPSQADRGSAAEEPERMKTRKHTLFVRNGTHMMLGAVVHLFHAKRQNPKPTELMTRANVPTAYAQKRIRI